MKALSTLKLYCNNRFPHYHKVKILMGQMAGSSEVEHDYNIANVVQCMEGLVIGSHFPTTQLPASSHASESQLRDSANQTIQMPLRLEPHPRNHQSSTSSTRGRMGNDPAIHDDSSHLFPEIEGFSSAALVGVAGAMNHLVSNIRPPYENTKEAMEFLDAESSLSEDERAILCIYYGKNMIEAAALSLMGSSLRRAVFRKVLEGLPSDFCIFK
jgi:hypothetical protein